MTDTNDLHGKIGNGSYTVVRSVEQALLAIAVYAKEGFPLFSPTFIFCEALDMLEFAASVVVIVENGTSSVEHLEDIDNLQLDMTTEVPLADIKALAQLL